MPHFNQMSESKYLKQQDFPQPALLTVQSFAQENVAMQGQPEEKKWICYFNETEKGLVLNSTNMQLMELATGCQSTEDAVGKQIVLFNDPSISFGGKLTGGIRIRAPKQRAQAQPTHGIMGKPVDRPPQPAAPVQVGLPAEPDDSDTMPF